VQGLAFRVLERDLRFVPLKNVRLGGPVLRERRLSAVAEFERPAVAVGDREIGRLLERANGVRDRGERERRRPVLPRRHFQHGAIVIAEGGFAAGDPLLDDLGGRALFGVQEGRVCEGQRIAGPGIDDDAVLLEFDSRPERGTDREAEAGGEQNYSAKRWSHVLFL
jgi:hypothetical protein